MTLFRCVSVAQHGQQYVGSPLCSFKTSQFTMILLGTVPYADISGLYPFDLAFDDIIRSLKH